uniref:Minor capsid protein P9 transmembrane helices domain-containing protein n=1 Tax=viral metagenome TaxID=1070528 RepID=A0A6C0KS96_9ZZZZ
MYEKIWFDDLQNFITYDNYYVILPLQQMSIAEKINAIVRFFVYLGIFLTLLKNDYRYLFFGIIAGLLSIFLYNYEVKQKIESEKFLEKKQLDIVDNKVCSRSTVDNPFMNSSIADISLNPEHPQACNIDNNGIKNVIKKNYDRRMFKDVSDIYDKLASQRQFYTMPVTTIPGDQKSFAEWCYGNPATCKDGNGEACYRNQYVVRTH